MAGKDDRVQVDWTLAAATGRRVVSVVGSGPATTDYTVRRAREQLSEFASAAEGHVRSVTGMIDVSQVRPARTVDRLEWVDAASRSMSALVEGETVGRAGLGAKIAGAQAGAMFGLVAGAVLGQYDPFGIEGGELLLVVPNIISVERALKVSPDDFRMWVCLHEVTHRVQFGANPWLRDYMRENVAALAGGDGAGSVSDLLNRFTRITRIGGGAADSGDTSRPTTQHSGVIGVLQKVTPPEQFAAIERLLMLGTLLEGHADHVMDAVGPSVIPTVGTIRAAFDRRRAGPSNPVQRLLRALLGMDAKTEQYVRGKKFVDAVVADVGMASFNRVWSGPDTLPLADELDDPARWIARVL